MSHSNVHQAIRNSYDATCISVPSKYKKVGDFQEYYNGQRLAPYLTIYCGGNHEVSNYHFELYYGGWVVHNIYYLGAANVVRLGPIRISGMSGIWKGYDFRKPHYERLPYNFDELHSVYHTRELDVRKLLQVRTQVDVGLSHDWPRGIESFGDFTELFRKKRGFLEDSKHGRLGNAAAREVLDRLRPAYWFSAHLHVLFAASMPHDDVPLRLITPAADRLSGWAYEVVVPETPNKGITPMDGNASSKPSPQETVTNRIIPAATGDIQSKLAAWHNFQPVAEATARQATETLRANHDAIVEAAVKTDHLSYWTPVRQEEGRRVYGTTVVTKTDFNLQNANVDHEAVQNADEIDLDLSSNSSQGSPSADASPAKSMKTSAATTDGTCDITPQGTPKKSLVDQAVAENLRNKLPASLARAPANSNSSRPKKTVPAAVQNKLTKFLALDKPGNRDPYLQLVEIQPVSEPVSEKANVPMQRPFRLQYDKEWLAITRVFANDLSLGDPAIPVPADAGEEEYLKRILEAEQWVEENVVKRGLLNIPYNFNRTAPKYDPTIPITTTELPFEYNNIQTAEFCELLGIPNKFHLTEEERAARTHAGPRPMSGDGSGARHGGPRGHGGSRGGRNSGRGSRGIGRGGRGGRGRGQ